MTSLQRVIISRLSLRGRDATHLRFGVSSPTPSNEQTRCQTIASASREEPVARRQPRSSSSADTPNVTKGYLPGEWHSPFWQTTKEIVMFVWICSSACGPEQAISDIIARSFPAQTPTVEGTPAICASASS